MENDDQNGSSRYCGWSSSVPTDHDWKAPEQANDSVQSLGYTDAMQLIIDDVEGELVRLESLEFGQLIIPRAWLPSAAVAGDHLNVHSDQTGSVYFSLDSAATKAAFERAKQTLETLTKNDPGGDVQL